MQFIIFWNFSMFQYRPDSPQVKQNLISTITNFVRELPHELQNGLRIITLGQPQLLFVIFKGGKQLLTATWRISYNFKTSYFHIAGWTEYLTE